VDLSLVPALNAGLNAAAAICLVVGRRLVRRGRIAAHRRAMLSAFALSSLFLVLYVAHKLSRGFESTHFHVAGAARVAYLALLFSHVVLAMAIPPLAISLVALALRGRVAAHRRLARVAWPIWIYVSLTGVAIYLLLYPLNSSPS